MTLVIVEDNLQRHEGCQNGTFSGPHDVAGRHWR